ncbi:MAG: efflux RND transporter permease subunit [Acidobacteriia bacterium]|nr:efflux RND transporter permease subunit [Terriglobia bacterium]
MPAALLKFPQSSPRAFLLVAAILWLALYKALEPASHVLVSWLPVEGGTHLYDALQFFFYDTPKVLLLLAGIVFVMGMINSHFTPEHTRALLAGRREGVGNVMAASLGIVTPFCSCSAVPLFIGFVQAGTRGVFAERTGTGYFLNFRWNREQLARYGLSVEDAQVAVENAIGGEDVTTVVEGRERYPVNVRYLRDFRSDQGALQRVLVPVGGQRQLPLGELAEIGTDRGPAMIRDENGMLTGYVYVDVADRDAASYVSEAGRVLQEELKLPAGYAISWSGQYEAMERVKHRLTLVVPLTLGLIVLLLYANTRSLAKTTIILLAVPFSAVGALCFLYLAGYNMSIGVWVGLIALLGIDAETGVYMLLYLDLAYEEARRQGRLHDLSGLREAIVQGAAKRLRPKFMTFATMCIGLLPIMWATGTGSDVMKRIAAPMVGGIFTSFLLELLVYPAIYEIWRWRAVPQQQVDAESLMGYDEALQAP